MLGGGNSGVCFGVALSALALLISPAAEAQGEAAMAEALFDQARQAMENEDYDTACRQFRESNNIDPAAGTLFNLANCEEQRGRLATAWELYVATMDQLSAEDDRRPIAQARADALAPRLPKLTITLAAGAPSTTKITRGEVALSSAAFGVALPLDPGEHQLTVQAPGYEPATLNVSVAEAESKTVEVAPGAKLVSAAPTADPEPTHSTTQPADSTTASGSKTLGYILGGVGVAGLAVGATTGFMALKKKDTADDNCRDDLMLCNQTGKDANDSGRKLATISTVGFVGGAILTATGAYFLFFTDDEAEARVSAAIGPEVVGATWSQTF